jgi:hypothetical protein
MLPGCQRLTPEILAARRALLRADWIAGGPRLRLLNVEQQWALHDFYSPGLDLPDTDVAERRDLATTVRPELIRAAGFAYRSFARTASDAIRPNREKRAASGVRTRPSRGRLRVEVKPEQQTDMTRLVDALLLHAREKEAALDRSDQPSRYRYPPATFGE